MKSILLLLIIPSLLTAQVNPVFLIKSDINYNRLDYKGDGLFGFESNDKFGYVDKTGKVIIQPDYSYSHNTSFIPDFVNGFAVIKKDGKRGLVDKTGKVVIPFQYESIVAKANSKTAFIVSTKSDNKTLYGLVSSQNKVIIPVTYDNMALDSNWVTVYKNSKWGLMDITGKELLPAEYSSLVAYPKEKLLKAEKGTQMGYIDNSGKWIFEKAKSVFTLYGCYEGMIQYMVNSKYGYLDTKGNEVIISKYDYANSFENIGLAKVGKKSPASTSITLYGYVDKKGTEVIPVKYENLGLFNNGLVYAKDPETNRYGYFDKTGKWVLNPLFLDVTSFDLSGGAWVKMTDGKFHYIDKTGKDLGTLTESGITYKNFSKDGLSTYENSNNSFVLLDKTMNILKIIDDCDGIYSFSEAIAGYKSKSKGLYGFLDINGNKIIPPEYSNFTGFADGISKVSKLVDGKTKSGYITKNNEIILPVKYDTLFGFRDSWGLLKNNGKYFFVDRNGNLKDPPRDYDELLEFRSGFALGKIKSSGNDPHTFYYINTQLKETFSISAWQAYLFWEDIAVVSRNDKTYEMMNKKGEIFKTLDHVQTLKFCNDGMLTVKEAGKWGFINTRGETIVKPTYDSTESFKYGFGRIRTGTKWGIVDKSGTVIFETKYDNIFPGENGLFIFYNGTGWGVMDKTGKILKDPVLFTITAFEKDRSLARLGKTFSIIKSPLAK